MTEVAPDFGALRYWIVAKNAPVGSLADRARGLWTIVEKRERTYQKRSIKEPVIRALALELAAAFARTGQAMTPEMLQLLAWAMRVPQDFLRDQATLYSGYDGKGQGVDPELKYQALRLDVDHLRERGGLMSELALSRAIGVSRKTIGTWRKEEPIYRDAIRMLVWLNNNHPQYLGKK